MLTSNVVILFGLITIGWPASRVARLMEPKEDGLQVITLNMGEENEDANDEDMEFFSGATAYQMITVVRVEYYESNGIKHLRCLGFTYGDQENNCPAEPSSSVNTVVDFELDKDEFILFVSGDTYLSISSIYMVTNKDRHIGPFGPNTDPFNHDRILFKDEAPVLYVEGYRGQWVYSLYFSFHYKNVLKLEEKTNEIALRSYEALQGPIDDLYTIKPYYWRMLPDVSRMGCAYFDTNPTLEAEIACDMKTLLDQLNILTTASTALQNHTPRNLLTLKDYDSSKYLDEVRESKNFHNLLTDIKFGMNVIINVTQQQSEELSDFFSTSAEFDREIAVQDYLFIKGQLESKEEGSLEATELVGDHLLNILAVATSMAALDLIQESIDFVTVLAAELNPWTIVVGGGPDVDALSEAYENLLNAVSTLVELSVLMAHLDDFVQNSYELSAKFAENQEAIDAMSEIIRVMSEEDDPDVVAKYADEYIKSYGDYSPQVSNQDIAYTMTLLDVIAETSCGIIDDIESSNPAVEVFRQLALDSCTFIPAHIAVLASFYDDIYTLQFEMIDSLTSIVRGDIAVVMADRIGSIDTTIDIRTAAIGSAIVEINYQAASMARCDILEYLGAGKRPAICEVLLFRDDDIQKLIAYTGSLAKSERDEFAYLPITPQADTKVPYINITKLLRGGYEKVKLPIDDKEWLKKYGWLPSSFDPETGFFYYAIEMYLPGLMCNETGEAIHSVRIEALSSNPTNLYSQKAPPKYHVDKHLVKFEYKEPVAGCAGSVKEFPVRDSDTLQIKEYREICIVSKGDIHPDPKDDFTYPSLYTTWIISLTGHHDCTLVDYLDEMNYLPLITVRYKMLEVMVKKEDSDEGINECWPDGSRCPPGEMCKDMELKYCCQDSEGECD